jgi:Nif-specific regulatory protein
MFDQRFDIIEQIATTPTSEVLKAFDKVRNRLVAIKKVGKSKTLSVDLLKREFETLTYLDHPNIIKVYDFGEEASHIYYTMDFYAAHRPYKVDTLRDLPDLVDFSLQLLSALDYVHRRGIIHGDVKPSNVFEGTSFARRKFILGDFGLVRFVENPNIYPISGTMEYIAPEVFQGVSTDPRSDLYSLGVMLFRIIASCLPFLPGDDISKVKRKTSYKYLRLAEVVPGAYPELDEFAAGLIQHNPADRFVSAYEAITALVELAKKIGAPLPEQPVLDNDLATGKFFAYGKELEELSRPPDRDSAGPEVFFVDGPAGCGKTSLIKEAGKVTQLRGGFFLYVDGSVGEAALTSLCKELERTDPGARERGAASGRDVSRSLETTIVGRGDYRFALETSALKTLAAISERYNFSLVALDHVDPEDAELASSIARLVNYQGAGRVKFVVALSAPTGFGALADKLLSGSDKVLGIKKFNLKGFSPATTEEYLKYVLGVTTLDPGLLRYVKDKAKGNPAVIRRIIESMASEKIILRGLDGWHVNYKKMRKFGVPSALSDYYAGVLGRLEEGERDALVTAAVYGYQFPEGLIEDKAILGKLVKSGAIVPSEGIGAGYSFANAGVHNCILERALGENVARASGRVIDFFEGKAVHDVEALATQGQVYLRTGDTARARKALSEAAVVAKRSSDHEKAIEFLETALATEGAWDDAAYERGISDLADSYSALGDHKSALGYYEMLINLRGREYQGSDGDLLKISKERLALGDYGKPARNLEGLLPDGLAVGDRFLRDALLAWAHYGLKDFGQAEGYARAAEGVAEQTGRKDLSAYIKYIKGVVLFKKGDADAALAELAEAARSAEEAGNLRLAAIALNQSGDALVWKGEFDRADEANRKSVELARKADDRYAVVASLTCLGRIYFNQGYVKRAQREYDLAEAECKIINNKDLLALIYLSSCANMIQAGEYRKAEFYLYLLESLDTDLKPILGNVYLYRALLYAETNELGKALKELEAAEEAFATQKAARGVNETRSLRGRVYYLKGDYAAAERELSRCLAAVEEAGDKLEYAKIILTLGELALSRGDFDVAASHVNNALARFSSLKNKYYLGKSYLIRVKANLGTFRRAPGLDIMAEAEIDLENSKALFKEIGVDKYRAEISGLEGELFMAKQPEKEQSPGRLTNLVGGLKGLSNQPDLDELLNYILSYLTEELSADRGVIFLFDEHRNMLHIKGTAGIDDPTIEDASAISQTIVGQVAGSKKPVVSADAVEDFRFKDSHSVRLHGIRSLMCIPIAAGEEFQGVVYLDSLERDDLFKDEDFDFAIVFAQNAAYEIDRKRRDSETLQSTLSLPSDRVYNYECLVGSSSAMAELRSNIETAARNPINVLITGESGTGKELVARMVHHNGINADKPFIGISCAAIPEALLESELFGIEKGTATGVEKKMGRFERAGEGTIFLDEVGAMDVKTQSKFLRVLQEREFERLGSREFNPIKLRARVVSATNADLLKLIEVGKFREDLYYRLNIYLVNVPPLREHDDDIPELVEHFLALYYKGAEKNRPRFSSESMDILLAYDWPGNVRELENCVQYALVNSPSAVIEPAFIPAHITNAVQKKSRGADVSLQEAVARHERDMILKALQGCDWVKSKAARRLDISETNLRYKMKKHGITEKERFRIE